MAGIGANQVNDSGISPCPDKPNCVTSLQVGSSHYVAPLKFEGPPESARKKLLAVINQLPRTQVVENSGNYLRVTFTSLVFRFKDDVEFQFDENAGVIHLKSASRVGYSDFGANRRRSETIRRNFNNGQR
ncbi:MAG: DUF1499 domain-containing protein [Gammaproteobacteria bacterium]|nr:DUF1499 domain-containing protein [Gammaproteobacteria bacterium]